MTSASRRGVSHHTVCTLIIHCVSKILFSNDAKNWGIKRHVHVANYAQSMLYMCSRFEYCICIILYIREWWYGIDASESGILLLKNCSLLNIETRIWHNVDRHNLSDLIIYRVGIAFEVCIGSVFLEVDYNLEVKYQGRSVNISFVTFAQFVLPVYLISRLFAVERRIRDSYGSA